MFKKVVNKILDEKEKENIMENSTKSHAGERTYGRKIILTLNELLKDFDWEKDWAWDSDEDIPEEKMQKFAIALELKEKWMPRKDIRAFANIIGEDESVALDIILERYETEKIKASHNTKMLLMER